MLTAWHRARSRRGEARKTALRERSKEVLDFAQTRLAQTQELLALADQQAAAGSLSQRSLKLLLRLRDMHRLTSQAESVARRFALDGEQVPVGEKIFSVFEAHTELINRGKTPLPIEMGHRVAIIEDQLGFCVHGEILAKGEQDRDVTLRLVAAMGRRFGKDISLSFDRGFHWQGVEAQAKQHIDHPCIPTTGTTAAATQAEDADETWHRSRRRHAGVESAIGALQSGNGLERCRDRGEIGYARYFQLGLLARNLMVLGRIAAAKANPRCAAAHTRRTAA